MGNINGEVKKAKELIREKKTAEAVVVLESAAKRGNAEAMFELGLIYYRGNVIPGDLSLAWKWLEEADQKGHMKAPYYLGRICTYQGNDDIAIEWYERSAERGFHSAIARIGHCYMYGKGVPRSIDSAHDHFLKATKAGNLSAHVSCIKLKLRGHRGLRGVFLGIYDLFKFLGPIIVRTWKSSDAELEEIKDRIRG